MSKLFDFAQGKSVCSKILRENPMEYPSLKIPLSAVVRAALAGFFYSSKYDLYVCMICVKDNFFIEVCPPTKLASYMKKRSQKMGLGRLHVDGRKNPSKILDLVEPLQKKKFINPTSFCVNGNGKKIKNIVFWKRKRMLQWE